MMKGVNKMTDKERVKRLETLLYNLSSEVQQLTDCLHRRSAILDLEDYKGDD